MTLQHLNRWGLVLLPVLILAIYLGKQATRELAQEVRVLEGEAARLQQDLGVLRAELAVLKAPERLDRLARKHLKLAEPRADQYIELPERPSSSAPLLPPHHLPGEADDITATIPPEILPSPEERP